MRNIWKIVGIEAAVAVSDPRYSTEMPNLSTCFTNDADVERNVLLVEASLYSVVERNLTPCTNNYL